jgi:uncharacterized membrane protein
MDHAFLLLLRLLHVVGGVLWVGGVCALAWFVVPTVQLEGEHGVRFASRMMLERKLSQWLSHFAGMAILSGIVLYWRATAGTDGAFARSPAGMVFGVGGTLALAAMVTGLTMGTATGRKMGSMRARLVAESRAPTTEEGAELARLAARNARGARITAVLLVLAAAAMGVARYA